MRIPSKIPADWFVNLPNKLTVGRIIIAPILLFVYPIDLIVLHVFMALIFAAAAISDYFDGYLARRYDQGSQLGELLDPIADKLLTTCALVALTNVGHAPAWMAGLLISREIAVSGLRLIALREGLSIEVSKHGKLKTGFQGVGIFCLMVHEPILDIPFMVVGMLALWGALFLSYYSGYEYWKAFWKHLPELTKSGEDSGPPAK